jgi:3-phenylpropionate/trans-cinnamate dioxygenase ferredoxin subunit
MTESPTNGTSPKGELVCNVNDIEVKQALRILIDDYPVAIVKDSDGGIHAIGDTCSHADISLSEGDVEGCKIECWGHGSQFDLRTGMPLQLPAYEPVPVFALEIQGDEVYVDVTTVINSAPVPDRG